MSESVDSGHDTTSTIDTNTTDNSGTTLNLGKIPYCKQQYQDECDVLPKLPSHKFRYSVWHDLRETCLTGDVLHAPRVRAGPAEKDKQFQMIKEDGLPIHHNLTSGQRQNYINQWENWENATVINLCYQELDHEYQKSNFLRILNRCQAAVTVNLSHNTIVSLNRVTFRSCEYLNVNFNYLRSFKDLPGLSKVKTITAVSNCIRNLNGLETLRGTPLEELTLAGNPVSFTMNYRQLVFSKLPHLLMLDGIPRLPEDTVLGENPEENSRCTIS